MNQSAKNSRETKRSGMGIRTNYVLYRLSYPRFGSLSLEKRQREYPGGWTRTNNHEINSLR
jgi:hypothetical protein